MGFFVKSRYVNLVMIMLSLSIQSSSCYDAKSLSTYFRDQANMSIAKPRTGTLYNVSLPSNFTGTKVTFVRLRSGSFRVRGANFCSFDIPQNVVPEPFVKRLTIVYEYLGDWSYSYYKVPYHSLVAPIVGFSVYDSPSVLVGNKINISVRGNPISIRFDKIELKGKNKTLLKCVRFGDDGGFLEMKSMTLANGCQTRSQGHFSLVVPSGLKRKYLKWWLIGFGGGFLGIVLIILATMAILKGVKSERVRAMERQSENGTSFGTFWVGDTTKLPSASMIRTQPGIEDLYVI